MGFTACSAPANLLFVLCSPVTNMNVISPSAAVEGIALGYSFSVSCNINYVFIVGTSIGSGDGLTRFEKSDVPF